MKITTEQIKELRNSTGISVMQCKKALEEAKGDKEKALEILRKKSKDIASKKSDRTLGAGVVQSYVHAGSTVGTLVELSCETDFVAKNEEFVAFAYDLAMHVAASNPHFINKEEVSADVKKKAEDLFKKEVEESGKPEDIQKKMMDGKLSAYFAERVLLNQGFIKTPDVKVSDLIEGMIQKFGEKIEVTKMVRFAIGE